jgi:hypothetical protein
MQGVGNYPQGLAVLAPKTVEECVAHKPLKRLFLVLFPIRGNRLDVLMTRACGNSLISAPIGRCDKDHSVGIERYVIRIQLCSSSRGEGTVE